MATKEYDIQGFDRIRIGGAFEFSVSRGGVFKVSITSDPLKTVEVRREGDTLRIGQAWYSFLWGWLTFWAHPSASITMPELRELRVSGASHGEVSDFSTTHDFAVELAGASSLRLGNVSAGDVKLHAVGASQLEFSKASGGKGAIEVMGASRLKGDLELSGDLRLDVAGASRIELTGSAMDAVYNFAGASQAKLENFNARNARVKTYGASNVVVKTDGRLDVEAMGASHVSWVGNPTMGEVRSGGASTLRKA
jgi:Putative auto-transporter adhesin, head GIN domain